MRKKSLKKLYFVLGDWFSLFQMNLKRNIQMSNKSFWLTSNKELSKSNLIRCVIESMVFYSIQENSFRLSKSWKSKSEQEKSKMEKRYFVKD